MIRKIHDKAYRIGLGRCFIQFDYGYWWCYLLRIHYKGFAISRAVGFHTRDYSFEKQC